MLSNNFWYGFLGGAALVFGIFLLTHIIARARAKQSAPTGNEPTAR
jgi:hypothetical protein